MINTENIVKAKYSTKNNTTFCIPVFLAIKNHINAITSSIRNLSEIATRLCMVWLSGSLVWPLIKMIIVTRVTAVNIKERAVRSLKDRFNSMITPSIEPEPSTAISNSSRYNRYLSVLLNCFLFQEVFNCKINSGKNAE